MPYIPPQNRPAIDRMVDDVAEELAQKLVEQGQPAEISSHYRRTFMETAEFISQSERNRKPLARSSSERLAQTLLEKAAPYGIQGGWTGELNYALTMLIQKVPHWMAKRGVWEEALRYWVYAQTVGALTRTAYALHACSENDYIGNGLTGVFEDVKDEYKRRVNTAYEAAQILKSGDCYDFVPFRTCLVPVTVGNTKGYQEIMLPKQELPS